MLSIRGMRRKVASLADELAQRYRHSGSRRAVEILNQLEAALSGPDRILGVIGDLGILQDFTVAVPGFVRVKRCASAGSARSLT